MHLLSIPIVAAFMTLLPASAGRDGAIPFDQDRSTGAVVTQRVIIRVPRMAPPPRGTKPPSEQKWEERRAPRCMPTTRLAAAAVSQRTSIDLLTNDGQRMRAKLDKRCRTIDFYSGFYVSQTEDGQICARRDSIRTRSGGLCRIEAFRRLVPED